MRRQPWCDHSFAKVTRSSAAWSAQPGDGQWWDHSLARLTRSSGAWIEKPVAETLSRADQDQQLQAAPQPHPQAPELAVQPRAKPQMPSPSSPSCKAPPTHCPLVSSVGRRFVRGPDACLLGSPDASSVVYMYYLPDGRPRTKVWFASDGTPGHGRWLGQEVSEDPGQQDHMLIYEHVCTDRWRLVWW